MPEAVRHIGTQTLVTVTPAFQTPEDPPEKVKVRCTRGLQTEVHLDFEDNIEQVEGTLRYTPYSNILYDAILVKEIPKKVVLKFDDRITEEDIEHFDENSTWDASDLDHVLNSSIAGKSNLRRVREKMAEEMINEECQTSLMVRPMFLELDDVAQVMCNLQVQTSRTFTPNASIERVDKDLHTYYIHEDGSRTVTILATKRNITDVAQEEEGEESEEKLMGYFNEENEDQFPDTFTTTLSKTKEQQTKSPPRSSPQNAAYCHGQTPIISSEHIKFICEQCCSEDEVLACVKAWYDEVGECLEEGEYEGNIDPITGQNLDEIESQIIANVSMTAESLQAQADRMEAAYSKKETEDIEIQCKEFADHKVPGDCFAPFRDKACTCDCQLYAKKEDKGGNADFNICAKKLAELCKLITAGGGQGSFAERLNQVISSPALMSGEQTFSDLSNKLPLKARACTNRKCNCLYSKGCLHCEVALNMQKKQEDKENNKSSKKDPDKLKTCKTYVAKQNIEFLTEVDGEYADAYLEALEQDDAFTQTDDFVEEYFGTDTAPIIKAPECTCLTNVEMPWDMILLPPTPKKRPEPEETVMEALPEEVRAQLKELTVRPITEEQLLELTKEFLKDNLCNAEDIDEIQKQILEERARIDAELESGAVQTDEGEDEPKEEEYKPCRPRPPLRQFQVYDPEDEVYNEPYLDRMMRYFGDEQMEGVGECTSRVEMPWYQIELPKKVVLRKGKNPCSKTEKPKCVKDTQRKCGPEYREKMKLQGDRFSFNADSANGIGAGKQAFSNPDLSTSNIEDCICKTCGSTSQPDIPLKKGDENSCICPPDDERVSEKGSKKKGVSDTSVPCPGKSVTSETNTQLSQGIISCLKGSKKKTRRTSASVPVIPKNSSSCVCSKTSDKNTKSKAAPSSTLGTQSSGKSGMDSRTSAPQSRTERIAALLDSCKREMEPIKDGINQLRARIKELNIPDMMAYQEPPQHPGVGGMGISGSGPGAGMGFMGGMPPMCFPPMMCYPFPPPCPFPPGAAGGPYSANAQVTRIPREMSKGSSGKKCRCKSKRRRPPSSSYNSSSDTGSPSTDYEEKRHRNKKKSSRRSRSRLLGTCGPQESETIPCPNRHTNSESAGFDRSQNSQASQNADSSKSALCVCKACPKSSKIPRLVSQNTSNKSSFLCPDPSCFSQRTGTFKSCLSNMIKSATSCKSDKPHQQQSSSFKSCLSNLSGKSVKSCMSDKSFKNESRHNMQKDAKSGEDLCGHCSLMMVESCATQKSQCNISTCMSLSEMARSTSTSRPPSTIVQSAATSCKIRFSEQAKRNKCKKCFSSKYRPEKADIGVEVKKGRPVEESSEELTCITACKSCVSRNA